MTCLYAVHDPHASRLHLANAGHVPPVTVTREVASGERLVMGTDGLVEVRAQGIGGGLAALCESAAHPAATRRPTMPDLMR
ncbi:hypothetical protein ADL21_38410 [Streptomyces albus subsp. albus]|nr:hypothetical protein ADL21_38410 [Streptomyces albus subsp. albus]